MSSIIVPNGSFYRRLPTKEVKIGNLLLGNGHPIRVQTMTTTDTMDTKATVAQVIRCIEAGAELVRITAPSKKEAENLLHIKNAVRAAGFDTPLVADIHFTPNAAEVAARLIEKVRINPGNYVDKKKFDFIDYTDNEYTAEIERIRDRFTPLVRICKEHGTAMRIGTNHGSLSDRIMSRYGDTPIGMVESAMEFLRIARDESYHQIILSMKSSNPLVVVQAYRLLVSQMQQEFGECYPLHLGVTEAGDGEDGRIKSAIGIGTLLEEGIGDTIRVSLTEDPEFEIPVCKDIIKKYPISPQMETSKPELTTPFDPFHYNRRHTNAVFNIGEGHVPVVVADFSDESHIRPKSFVTIGYTYDVDIDKWTISDGAADYVYLGKHKLEFDIPGTLRTIVDAEAFIPSENNIPLFTPQAYINATNKHPEINFISFTIAPDGTIDDTTAQLLSTIQTDPTAVLCALAQGEYPVLSIRPFLTYLQKQHITTPIILSGICHATTIDEQLINLSTDTGALFLDGIGDGIWLMNDPKKIENTVATGRTYLEVKNNHHFLNHTAFSILQATRTRISKTEYISCPSCGRTLFDLQETTAKIRSATHHLKGLKIAVMGCIVNGPGEMADADFGYVGSGPGKITLYKGKDVMQKNVASEVAVEALIQLLKDHNAWIDK